MVGTSQTSARSPQRADLRRFDTLQRKRIRVIRYRGFNKVETIDELVGQKGYAIAFEGLIGYQTDLAAQRGHS